MKYKNIREEELKNKVGAEWFTQFDTTEILGNIDNSSIETLIKKSQNNMLYTYLSTQLNKPKYQPPLSELNFV